MNIREYLNDLDNTALENNEEYYDLRNLYDSKDIDNGVNTELEALINNNADSKAIFEFLTNGSSESFLNEGLITVEVSDEDVEEVYSKFMELLDSTYVDYDMVASKAEAMYEPHKGEAAWDEAFKRWNCEDCCPCEDDIPVETIESKLAAFDSRAIQDETDFLDLKTHYDAAGLSETEKTEVAEMLNNDTAVEDIDAYLLNKINAAEEFNDTEEQSPIETFDKDKILNLFASLMDNRYIDADGVFAAAEKLYIPHQGEAAWDQAYAEFTGKTTKGLHESLEVKAPEKSITEFLEELEKARFIANESYIGMRELFEADTAAEKAKDADFIRQNANKPEAIAAYFAGKNSTTEELETAEAKEEILTEAAEKELFDLELEWVSDFDSPSAKDIEAEVKQLAFESNAEGIELVDFIPGTGDTLNKVIIRGTEDDLRNCLITYCAGDEINAEALFDNAVKVVDTDVEVANEEEPLEEAVVAEETKELPSEITYTFEELCPDCNLKTEQEVADIVMDRLVTDYGKKVTFKLDLQPDSVRVYEIIEDLTESEHTDIEIVEPPYDSLKDKQIDDAIDALSDDELADIDKLSKELYKTEGLDGDKTEYDNGAKCTECGKNAVFEIEDAVDANGDPIYQCQNCGHEYVKHGLFGKKQAPKYYESLEEDASTITKIKAALDKVLDTFENAEGAGAFISVEEYPDKIVIEIDGVDAYDDAETVDKLDLALEEFDPDAYFDAEDYGIITAVLFKN